MPSTLSASNDLSYLSFDLVCASTYANAPGSDAILAFQDLHWDGEPYSPSPQHVWSLHVDAPSNHPQFNTIEPLP